VRGGYGDAGVTLVEMMIIVAIVGLIAALTFPSAAAGIDAVRLRSASNEVVTFFNVALERATRYQQVVELRISPTESAMAARSEDSTFVRAVKIEDPVRIVSVQPMPPGADPNATRRFLVYPGGAVPKIAIELATKDGRKKLIAVDPITGMPRMLEAPAQ